MRSGALLLVLALPAAARSDTPPAPSAPRPVILPRPAERTLANGLRVVVAERRGVPLASAVLLVKTGAEADKGLLAGLADVTASLLTKGAGSRTAPQLAEAIEALGGSISSEAGWDSSAASVSVLAPNLEPALSILADVTQRPTFAGEELERLRAQRLDDLALAIKEPGTLAAWAAQRLVYGDGPYAHPAGGTPESVARLTRDDVVRFHRTHYRPGNAVLVVTGDVTAGDVFALSARLFGGWKASGPAARPKASAKPAVAPAPRVVVIDKPGAGQAAVVVTALGLRRLDPDYTRGRVANSVLSGYSGRLNQEIRIKRGLSYGARSSLSVRREKGPFVASCQTKNESAAEVATLLLGELERLAAGELPAEELTPRKAVLIGDFGRRLETSAGLADELAALALHGIPFAELGKTVSGIEAVTAEGVKDFARRTLPRGKCSLVIVGEAAKFLPALKEKFPAVEVIPEGEVDLGSKGLRKPTGNS